MNTEQTINALKICRSAVDTAGVFPIFSQFCFAEGYVYGYNDICAILTPIECNVRGGLLGEVLVGVLATMPEEFEVEQDEDKVTIRGAGSTKVELACTPDDAFLFKAPDDESWDLKIKVNDTFFSGLQRCTQTVGDDAQHKELTGVAFRYDNKGLVLYSSDDMRLSKFDASECTKADPNTAAGTWLLAGRAAALLGEAWQNAKAALSKKDTVHLCFSADWVKFEAPNLVFYSKLLPDTPPNYPETLKKIAPKDAVWQEVPDEFRATVARALVLVAKDPTAAMSVNIDKKVIKASLVEGSGVRYGELADKIPLSTSLPALALTLGIVKLSASLEGAEEFCFNAKCVGLRSGMYHCWVAPLQNDEE